MTQAAHTKAWLVLTACAAILGATVGLIATRGSPQRLAKVPMAEIRPGLPGDHVRRRYARRAQHRDVTVLVALDTQLRERDAIEADIERWLEIGSKRLAVGVPISLSIQSFTAFDPPARSRYGMDSALAALRFDCRDPEADIVLGFTANQYTDWRGDTFHGQAEALGRYAVIQPAHDDADTGRTVAHEVAHLFGAWHETPTRHWIDSQFGPSAGSVIEATLHRDFRRGPAGIPLRNRRWIEELHRHRQTCECGHPSPLVDAWLDHADSLRSMGAADQVAAARCYLRAALLLRRDPRTRGDAAQHIAHAAALHWGNGRLARARALYARAALLTDSNTMRASYVRRAESLARSVRDTSSRE